MIQLTDVYKIYSDGDNEIHALDGISLHIDKGEFVAIVGSSGSGKSTCMNIIGCLDVPTSGTYQLSGIDVSTMKEKELAHVRNKQLGFVFQQYNLIPKLNILENVELPLLYRGLPQAERRLEDIKKEIQEEKNKLHQLHSLYTKLKWVFDDLQRKMSSLTVSINQAINELDY